jgi:hypothetical protein
MYRVGRSHCSTSCGAADASVVPVDIAAATSAARSSGRCKITQRRRVRRDLLRFIEQRR